MDSTDRVTPYGSAKDLPVIKELEQQLAALKVFGWMLSADQRAQLRASEAELRRIPDLVDEFYRLLGPRNWVYTDDLATTKIEEVVSITDPEEAERRLIAYYQEAGRLDFVVKRLFRFEQMRERRPLIRHALADYRAGRYYAVALVLIPVMDGFVNDVETASRRGLHARDADDMVAWNSVTAHHLGLAHAHKSFQKSFRKTETSEVTELYRHGILHGTVVNFDNVVVATKAWNRLFAVTDWAAARAKQLEPVESVLSLRESLGRWRDVRDRSAAIDAWRPHDYTPGDDVPSEIAQVCTEFLRQWQHHQWAPVSAHLHGEQKTPVGKRALLAKDAYGALDLTDWELTAVRHTAASVAVVEVTLHVNGQVHDTRLRWLRADGDGSPAAETETGTWFLTLYGPANFLTPETVVAK
jgi:hypothetical protein